MFEFQNLAPKLLISEILNAPVVETESGPKLTSHGIYYNRVQIQVRFVCASKDGAFELINSKIQNSSSDLVVACVSIRNF